MLSLSSLLTALLLVPAAPSETDVVLDTLSGCAELGDLKCLTATASLKTLGVKAYGPLAARIDSLGGIGTLLALSVVTDDVSPEATEVLLKVAQSKRAEPTVRALAIDALGKRHDPRVLPLASALLKKDKAALVRQASVRILAHTVTAKDRTIIAALKRAAGDVAPEVRADAVFGLGFCNCAAAGPVLVKSLADKSVDVRRAAAEGLAFVKHRPAVARLVPLLRDEDDLLRRASARALRFQTDESLSDEPEVWEQWLTAHK